MPTTRRQLLERYVTVLSAGLDALRKLEQHTTERAGIPGVTPGVCVECMKYAVAVGLRGEKPQDAIRARCAETQVWQRRVWSAYTLLNELGEGGDDKDDSFAQARFNR